MRFTGSLAHVPTRSWLRNSANRCGIPVALAPLYTRARQRLPIYACVRGAYQMPCLSELDRIESRGLSRRVPCGALASAHVWMHTVGVATLDHFVPACPAQNADYFASVGRRMSLLRELERESRMCDPPPAVQRKRSESLPEQRSDGPFVRLRRTASLPTHRTASPAPLRPDIETHEGRGLGAGVDHMLTPGRLQRALSEDSTLSPERQRRGRLRPDVETHEGRGLSAGTRSTAL